MPQKLYRELLSREKRSDKGAARGSAVIVDAGSSVIRVGRLEQPSCNPPSLTPSVL